MKKALSFLLIIMLLASVLCGCGSAPTEKSDTISVVATIFPEYDWVRNVVGDSDKVDVSMLLDSGVDLHSYQPSADDIIKISTCDVFIYVGGESDNWVADALNESVNKNMIVIDLLDVLGDRVKDEEIVEGMEAEEEEEEPEEGPEYDEHVWLSVNNAVTFVGAIKDALCSVDSDNSAKYSENAAAYIEKLKDLDTKYSDAVSASDNSIILFGDRFPFRYLADDYGLTYYAAFVGCSAESEASFETVKFLADKVDELELRSVLTLEGSDQKIAETIVSTAESNDVQILSMDSMQSTTSKEVADGITYLSIMEKNLQVLTEALQ